MNKPIIRHGGWIDLRVLCIVGLMFSLLLGWFSWSQYGDAPVPQMGFLLLDLLLAGVCLLVASVTAVLRRWRAMWAILICVALAVGALYLAHLPVREGAKSRLNHHRAEYLTEVARVPMPNGERVAVFPWSDGRSFGPVFLVYDQTGVLHDFYEADALKKFPAGSSLAWERQVETTALGKSCGTSTHKMDVLRLDQHFYIVGCQDLHD